METDLTILPPAKDKYSKNLKQEFDKRLFNVHKGVLVLLIALPAGGKTTVILNLLGNSNFMKEYYENVHFIGPAFEFDPTLKVLIEHYGNVHKSIDDNVIDSIVQSQLEMENADKTNACIIVDDLMSQPSFRSSNQSSLSKLCSIHRHVLGGGIANEDEPDIKKSGGMLLISNQRLFNSIPRNARACADVILIGKVANKEEYGQLLKEYGMMFGGEQALGEMLNYVHETPFSFLCLYLFGDLDSETTGSCAYKNFKEKLYPTERWKAKKFSIKK